MGLLGALGGVGEQMIDIAQKNVSRWDKEAQLALEEQKAMRIAEFTQGLHTKAAAAERSRLGGVASAIPEEIDDPTHPEGKRKLTQVERNRLLAKAYEKSGDVAFADKFSDNATQEQRYLDEKEYRAERNRIEDEFRRGQITHQQAMEKIAAANSARQGALADIQINEAKAKQDARKKVTGLLSAAESVDMSQPGADKAREFYTGEAKRAKDSGDMVLGIGKYDPTVMKTRAEESKALREEAKAYDRMAAAALESFDKEGAARYQAKADAIRSEIRSLFGSDTETGKDAPPAAPKAQWNDKTGEVTVNGKIVGKAKTKEEATALARSNK